MILVSEGRYTSIYDFAKKEVTMCVISKDFSLFDDEPKTAWYAIVNLKTQQVEGEEDDKQAIMDYLMDMPREEQTGNMTTDSFLLHWARIDHGHKIGRPPEFMNSRFMQENFGEELKTVNTIDKWYDFLDNEEVQRRLELHDKEGIHR